MQQQTTQRQVTLKGVIDTVTFRSEETGYAVLKLKVDMKEYGHYPCVSRKGIAVLLGGLAQIGVGEKIEVTGVVKHNKIYGPQIEVQQFKLSEPRSITEITKYLSGNVFLIGKKLAGAIVAKFDEDAIRIIDQEPERLLEIQGIGQKRLDEFKKVWDEQREYRNLVMFCSSIGISSNLLNKIYRKYKQGAIEQIKRDPYALARDIWGIGFQKADEVARHLGINEMDPLRIRAAAIHVLSEASTRGDCFLWTQDLLTTTCHFLNNPRITPQFVGECILDAMNRGLIALEDKRAYLPEFAKAENDTARSLADLMQEPMPYDSDGPIVGQMYSAAVDALTVKLDDTQQAAVMKSLTSKVSVITGGPGTGKTTITKAVVAGFEEASLDVKLMAPTGRAAKRMTEVIGCEASTIHRVLYAFDQAIARGHATREDLLMHGVIIVDEVSMMDVKVTAWLLSYIAPDAILVLVGDKDQLPSVGPGAVLRDLLTCPAIPSTHLTKIHRQAQGSNIVVNAHEINKGHMPRLYPMSRHCGVPQSDFITVTLEDDERQAQAALWCATHMAHALGLDPTKDCQVLSPMHKGAAGVASLNAAMQQTVNPNPPIWVDRGGGVRWGVGDKVMQHRNNYQLGVLNGDIGVICDIEKNGNALKAVWVDFDGTRVKYDTSDYWCDLHLCYASTVHKVQGSEFPMIVMVLHTAHWIMLQRNLLYTGVTRGKKVVVLIYHPQALDRAVHNDDVANRNTYLDKKVAKLLVNAPQMEESL